MVTRAASALFIVLAAFLAAGPPPHWHDPSPHTVRFVTVAPGVRLEVLDWGGTGRALVLLAGGGNTAHVFDDFAPRLARAGHVYGITRRGFGESGFAQPANALDQLRDDVIAVLRALKLNKPVLIGHSIAGAELSAVAAADPRSIGGLIYLEAAYPYAFSNPGGPTMADFRQLSGPEPPSPGPPDLTSFASLREWDERVNGIRMPEAEFRRTWDSTPEGRPVKQRDSPGSQMFMSIMTSETGFKTIAKPALVVFAVPHIPEPWMRSAANPEVRNAAASYFAKIDSLAARQAEAIESAVPEVRVIRHRGMHYIFLSNEPDVLDDIDGFLKGLN